MKNYWVYWEGPMPRWIGVCIASMRRASGGCEFRLVTPFSIAAYLPRDLFLPNLPRLLHPSHRCDYYRAALLYLHGGAHFDADTVGLRSPEHLIGDRLAYSVWDQEPRRVIGAYLCSPPGLPVVARWLDAATRAISEYEPVVGLRWGELIEEALTPELDESCVQVPRTTFLPVDIAGSPDDLMSDEEARIPSESVCFGLNFSKLMNENRAEMLSDERTWATSKHMVLRLLSRYL